MKNAIKIRAVYNHSIEKVWQAISNKEALSEWLMPCDIEPIVGHHFQFKSKPQPGFDGIVNCKVLEVIKNEKLSFSWSSKSLDTVVTFHLTNTNGQTILNFEQTGFDGFFNKVLVRRILERGWKKKLLLIQLTNYLNK